MDEFGHWPKAPASARLRSILSNLTLTSLTIPRISDPTDYYASLPPQEDLNLEIVDEIRAVLQMQPRLEDLYFPPSYLADRFLSTLETSLLPSDIPSLKSLQAHPGIATSFLAISPGLESLTLFIIIWDDGLFSKFKASSATSRYSLRHLTIRVWYSDKWLWENLGKMFALFPNMETLDFTVNATASNPKPQPAKYFFEKIAGQSHTLQALQKLEFQYDSFLEGGSDIERESVVTFKRCPHLKTIITPKNQMWQFQQGLEGSAGSVLTVVGPIGLRWCEPESLFKDLPHPNEAMEL
ncbi:hypothetical protein FRC01_006507 [Tulasnella sp. 417]|nr:hypothetical protein FRC01_006507 [Tulasnella sp. 417]